MNDTPNPDLVSLMNFIGDRYVFSEAHYPGFVRLSPEQMRLFAVKHSILHMNKSVGALATEAEAEDHGGKMDLEKLKVATTKMLVNTIKLAEELAMSPAELAARVSLVMKST